MQHPYQYPLGAEMTPAGRRRSPAVIYNLSLMHRVLLIGMLLALTWICCSWGQIERNPLSRGGAGTEEEAQAQPDAADGPPFPEADATAVDLAELAPRAAQLAASLNRAARTAAALRRPAQGESAAPEAPEPVAAAPIVEEPAPEEPAAEEPAEPVAEEQAGPEDASVPAAAEQPGPEPAVVVEDQPAAVAEPPAESAPPTEDVVVSDEEAGAEAEADAAAEPPAPEPPLSIDDLARAWRERIDHPGQPAELAPEPAPAEPAAAQPEDATEPEPADEATPAEAPEAKDEPANEEPRDALSGLLGWTPDSVGEAEPEPRPSRRPDISKYLRPRTDDPAQSVAPTVDTQIDHRDRPAESEPATEPAEAEPAVQPEPEPEPQQDTPVPAVPLPPVEVEDEVEDNRPLGPRDAVASLEPPPPADDPGTSLDQLLSDRGGAGAAGGPRPLAGPLGAAPLERSLVLAPVLDGSADSRASAMAPLEPAIHSWPPRMPDFEVAPRVRSLARGNTRSKQVALTFDDGPHPAFTSQLLAVLDYYDVPATFFFVGIQALKYPHWVKMTHQAGHEVASQTYDHFRMPKLPHEEKVYQIDEYQRLIEGLIGVTPRFLRPPGGQYDAETERLVSERGMVLGLWDVALNDTRDGKTAKQMLDMAKRKIRSGSVVLAHDGIQATVDMLPELIELLRAEGYEFVTMSELAAGL